jgi:hypothetical protein
MPAAEPGFDLRTADPAAVFRAVTGMREDEFARLMEDPASRERVIEAIIAHLAGMFRAERAGDVDAVIHLKLWDRPGGGYDHFELVIADRTCVVSAEPSYEPQLTLKVRPSDLHLLVTGQAGALGLALKGRVRVVGDLDLGAKLPDLFEFDAR